MVTERTIVNGLIIGASLLLVPFLISESFEVDLLPIMIIAGLVALLVSFFVLKDSLCLWPYFGCYVLGALNFLPLPLNASHIFCILLIFYYITGYILIRQKGITLGKGRFLWPILIVTAIVLYHNHNFKLHAFGTGGTTEGERPAFLLYLGVLAYFCGINVKTPSVDLLSKVPLYCVVLTIISSLPFVLTTLDPGLAPYLYYITDSVNVEAYVDTLTTSSGADSGGIGRLGGFARLGGAVMLYLLCHYPIGTWVRPERWWVACVASLCLALTISSGYRSILFGALTTIMAATWCFYSWRALILPAIITMLLLIFYVAASNDLIEVPLNKLPNIAQRSLSFLPGNWDPEAIASADSSNDFRKNIQDVYIKEYLQKSPLIGNGFEIDTQKFNALSDRLQSGSGVEDKEYLQAQVFIEGKLFHTGWISLYDCVGIIGGLAFFALGWNEIITNARFIFGPKADRQSALFPTYVWLLSTSLPGFLSYFTVFGDFGQTFLGLLITAIVLSHLLDFEKAVDIPIALAHRRGEVVRRPLIGSAPNYGGSAGHYR
jgi:hypothetical protein